MGVKTFPTYQPTYLCGRGFVCHGDNPLGRYQVATAGLWFLEAVHLLSMGIDQAFTMD